MSDEYVYEYSQEEPREENTSTPRPKPTKTKQPTVIFGNPSKINFERIKLINKNTKVQQTNHQNILQSIPKGITIKKSPAVQSSSAIVQSSILPQPAIVHSSILHQTVKTPTLTKPKIYSFQKASASTSTPAVKSITSIPKITITPSLQSSQANKTETVKRIKISTSPNTTPASNSESNLNQHVSLSSLSSPPEQDTSIKPSTSKPSGIPKSTDATSHAESTTNETLSSALAEQDDTSFRSMVIKRFDDVVASFKQFPGRQQ
ncbi:putative protein TPRXL isoform X4 [Culex quinquefasciatus]|uniref:putative protein TPRXL isoform X4 n=1 Tax=Culex quinquefasciatus TaxID=7176 RepID=UPI0018E37E7A|nr:putative protein TPRXL isoform X4 [Culex quinquefasciatus]